MTTNTNAVVCSDCASVIRDHDSAHLSVQRGMDVFAAWLGLNRDGHHAEIGQRVKRNGYLACELTHHTFSASALKPAFQLAII